MARGVYSTSNYFKYASSLIPTTPCSISAWIYPTALTIARLVAGVFYAAGTGTSITGRYLFIGSDNKITAYQTNAGTANGTSSVASITQNAWNHVGATFTDDTTRNSYLAGVEATGTGLRALTNAPTVTGIGAVIRHNASTSLAAATCNIAEVAFWNVVLTAADMLQLAAGYSPTFVKPESLVAYYPLISGDSNGDEPDLMGGLTMVEQGTVAVASHPRVFYPGRSWIGVPTAAAGKVIPVFMNQYRLRTA